MASSWDEARWEAMFKQMNGDFVFREPGVVPRHYLVSMTEKAEIQRLLQSRRWWFVIVMILLTVIALVPVFAGLVYYRSSPWLLYYRISPWLCLVGLLVFIVFFGVLWLIGQLVISKMIGPALVGARYTEKRITLRERLETLSRLMPMSKIIGLGFLYALSSIVFGLNALLQWGESPLSPSSPLYLPLGAVAAIFAFQAGYFFYLAALKRGRRSQTLGGGQSSLGENSKDAHDPQ